MTLNTFWLLLTGVLLNAAAQLLLKAGVLPLGPLEITAGTALATAWRVARQWQVLAGLSCYVVSVCLWIVALSRVEVSMAYPMLSLGYVVNALAGWWLFGETLGGQRWLGLGLILVGVFVISRS